MKFALLLLGFGTTTSAQDDWEFANKLENPNLSLNLNDIVSIFFEIWNALYVALQPLGENQS